MADMVSPFRARGVSETCYRYCPKLKGENAVIDDQLTSLTDGRRTWGFGLCFLHLRHVKSHPWNHKRVYQIYCELELNLRISLESDWNETSLMSWRCRPRYNRSPGSIA